MRKAAALVPLITLILAAFAFSNPARAQDAAGFGGTQSFGLSFTYSPDSSHILIGNARQRRTWTAGAEYTHILGHPSQHFRFDYEAQILPFFFESDPTLTGTLFTFEGQPIINSQTPERVLYVTHKPIGSLLAGSGTVPVYGYFGRQNTYAASVTPLGARLTALPHARLQPTFGVDLGLVVSDRDIPLDDCDKFNYTFAIGPGIQFFPDARTSYRLEYVYRHVSNAGEGDQNPGIDQAVIRLTISRHR